MLLSGNSYCPCFSFYNTIGIFASYNRIYKSANMRKKSDFSAISKITMGRIICISESVRRAAQPPADFSGKISRKTSGFIFDYHRP